MFHAEFRATTIGGQPADLGSFAAQARADSHWTSVSLSDLAATLGATVSAERDLADVTFPVRRFKPGETLHRAGDKFSAIYVIRSGFFKTVSVDASGAELVLAFPMGGDVIGLDGLDPGQYIADVVALDTSHVAVVPFARLAHLGREHPCVARLLYSVFSRELVRNHGMVWLLGTLSAEARLAVFLLDLSERFGRLGYSRASFALRMTRQEMGSYLGIKLETVSRTFSAFAAAGLIAVHRKAVTLRDLAGLRRIVEPQADDGVERRARDRRPSPTARPGRALPRLPSFSLVAV